MFTKNIVVNIAKQWKSVFPNGVFRQKIGHGPGKISVVTKKGVKKDVDVVLLETQSTVNSTKPLSHRVFQRIFPSVCLKTLASELRRKAATQFRNQYGRRTFAFGFAGLSLVAPHEETKEESLSSEVRNIFSDPGLKRGSILDQVTRLSLGNFEFGQLIGQGCNAAVYEAKLSHQAENNLNSLVQSSSDEDTDEEDEISVIQEDEDETILADYHIESDDITMTTPSNEFVEEDSFEVIEEEEDYGFDILADEGNQPENFVLMENESSEELLPLEEEDGHVELYPLAIKMMYNYDIESRADSIMREMAKEAVPAKVPLVTSDQNLQLDNGNRVRLKSLPDHPNVVEMLGVFVDPVPSLSDGMTQYPAALPQRINPHGFGRNKTMFLVMKKYTKTLREYMDSETPHIDTKKLLLSQLLEGAVHLEHHGIAHRDIKSDNILLDCSNDSASPGLVIGDFGCCLADPNYRLRLPFLTGDIDRGGNRSLMAPEIACSVPGRYSVLDYSRSDLWAVGTLVYEIFGMENPFYLGQHSDQRLDSASYSEEDLPRLPDNVPSEIDVLRCMMLRRNPKQRPSPVLIADLMQISLWFPDWLSPGNRPKGQEVIEEILILATELLMRFKMKVQKSTSPKDQLKMLFLKRLNFKNIFSALDYYHSQLM